MHIGLCKGGIPYGSGSECTVCFFGRIDHIPAFILAWILKRGVSRYTDHFEFRANVRWLCSVELWYKMAGSTLRFTHKNVKPVYHIIMKGFFFIHCIVKW